MRIGILTGGGLGRVIAHWIVNGRPDVDVTGWWLSEKLDGVRGRR